MKLRLKRLQRSLFKFYGGCAGGGGGSGSSVISDNKECCVAIIKEIEWEVRPGGMIVQKRDDMEDQKTEKEGSILVRVATASSSQCCDISIQATSTFGELKMMLSKMTGLEPQEQRVLFKGKEREDMEHLHMVGVIDKDRVVMLEDPAIKESKVHGSYHYK